MLREQQCQAAEVRVSALAVGLRLVPFFLRPSVVDHVSQVVVGQLVVSMGIDQIVFGQFQNDCDQDKQLPDNLVEKIAMEARDFIAIK